MTNRKAQPTTTKKTSVARKLTVVKPVEVVKTKDDTVDEAAEKPKTVAGKAQILDAEKVKQIIALADAGSKNSEIAKQFGVASSHISNIVRGVTWTKVTGRSYTKGAYQQYHPQAAEKSAETKKAGK